MPTKQAAYLLRQAALQLSYLINLPTKGNMKMKNFTLKPYKPIQIT